MRNIYLDMGYSSMWSLLDKVSTKELKAEIPLIELKQSEVNKQLNELSRQQRQNSANLSTLKEVIDNRYMAELKKRFKLTDDHKKLVANICWGYDNPYNSLDIDEVIMLLGWEKPNDEPSNEQIENARKLLKEIPLALETILLTKLRKGV